MFKSMFGHLLHYKTAKHLIDSLSNSFNRLYELKDSVERRTEEWKSYYDDPDPVVRIQPSPFGYIQHLPWLIILRCLRPDKLVPAVLVSLQILMCTCVMRLPSIFISCSKALNFKTDDPFVTRLTLSKG